MFGIKYLLLMLLLLVGVIVGVLLLIIYFLFNKVGDLDVVFMLYKLVVFMSQEEDGCNEKFLKENLVMMVVKVGEMQVQMMCLDVLGECVQGLVGICLEEFNFKELFGCGGVEVFSIVGFGWDVGMDELCCMFDNLVQDVGYCFDYFNVVEFIFMGDKIKLCLLLIN